MTPTAPTIVAPAVPPPHVDRAPDVRRQRDEPLPPVPPHETPDPTTDRAAATEPPLRILVVDDATGAPIAHAKVQVAETVEEPWWQSGGPWVETDTEGVARSKPGGTPTWALVMGAGLAVQSHSLQRASDSDPFVVRARLGVVIRGHLRTPSGRAAPNVAVTVRRVGPDPLPASMVPVGTRRDGAFVWSDDPHVSAFPARFSGGAGLLWDGRSDADGNFQATQSDPGAYEIRMCEINGMATLRTERVDVVTGQPADFDFLLPNACVATILLVDQPALAPSEVLRIAIARESEGRSYEFDSYGDGTAYTLRAEPFRLKWRRVGRLVTDLYTPSAGEVFDVLLRGPLDQVETSIVVTRCGAEDVVEVLEPLPPPMRVRVSRMRSRVESLRSDSVLRLAVPRPTVGAVDVRVVGLRSGRIGVVSLDPRTREAPCTLGDGGGVSFRWADGKARFLDMRLIPIAGGSEARGVTHCPNAPDEQWSWMSDGAMNGEGTEMAVYGLIAGTYRAHLKFKGGSTLERDVTIEEGRVTDVPLDPPK